MVTLKRFIVILQKYICIITIALIALYTIIKIFTTKLNSEKSDAPPLKRLNSSKIYQKTTTLFLIGAVVFALLLLYFLVYYHSPIQFIFYSA